MHIISAIKKQTSDCSFYLIKSLYGISKTLKSGIIKKKGKKEKLIHCFILYC